MSDYLTIKELIKKYQRKELTYDELADQSAPLIKAMNDKNRRIAKKHGMQPKLVNLQGIMRNLY